MLNKREITVKIGKKEPKDGEVEEPQDTASLREKVQDIVQALEKPALKVFAGICIFVVLDTHRQVAIAKASNPK